MTKLFYIDPQSYNNLSVYDYSLLKGVEGCDISYYHNTQYQCEHIKGTRYKAVFDYNKKSGIQKALSYINSMLLIAKDIINERPDVIHIQWLRLWIVDIIFALFIRTLGKHLVFTAHNALPHTYHKGDKIKYKLYYKVVTAIIVHTQCTKTELIEDFGIDKDKINVIPHGILDYPIDNHKVAERCRELRTELNIGEDDIVFSCMGYQYLYKGIELVIKAWKESEVLHNNPKCHLLIVGKNRDVPHVLFDEVSIYNNVYILDQQLDDTDFNAFLRLTSVILLPYISISQSGLLFSAMCSNTPILVSNVGGLTDPLHYQKVGWCIGMPTIENVKIHMEQLVNNPYETKVIQNDYEAYEKIREIYSWSSISKTTSQLYTRLSGKN
ncbi:MAG: glycosyltransferase family 4 protein [Bacteroidaceae bacterium]|nr:glycosyltransferase family 4 protein [Bacteroidaceae bacterium]